MRIASCVVRAITRNTYHARRRFCYKTTEHENQKSGSVSRVLSWTAIYLGQLLPAGSSDLPAGNARAEHRLLGLSGGGVCPAGIVANSAVRSYRTISPLPAPIAQDVGCVFSVALSRPRFLLSQAVGRWLLAITVPCPARTFLRPRRASGYPTRSFNFQFIIFYLLFCSKPFRYPVSYTGFWIPACAGMTNTKWSSGTAKKIIA